MGKIFAFIFVVLGLTLIAVYSMIPGKLTVKASREIEVNNSAATRLLANHDTWPKLFGQPIKKTDSSEVFTFKGHHYTVSPLVLNAMPIDISYRKREYQSVLQLIPINRDSSVFEWKTEMETGLNPWARFRRYQEADRIQNEMDDLLQRMQVYFQNEKNAYGFDILHSRVKDTLLITSVQHVDHYPTTSEVYDLINSLKQYVAVHGAEETNPPMLNISPEDKRYRLMAALPINKVIPEEKEFHIKFMVPGNILVVETHGGQSTTTRAFRELERYIADNGLASPALPFESLITDRSQVSDTSQWQTKIYYPIY